MWFEASSESVLCVFWELPFLNNEELEILKLYCEMPQMKVGGLLQLLSLSQVFEKSEKQKKPKNNKNWVHEMD